MPTSDSWKGGSCFRERNPHELLHTKIEMELARKKRRAKLVEPNFTRATSGSMAIVTELEGSVCERYYPNLSKAEHIIFGAENHPSRTSQPDVTLLMQSLAFARLFAQKTLFPT